jgi:hypothetical protein
VVIHVHAVEALRATSLQHANTKMSEISPKAGSLSVVIRSYKSAVSRWAGLNEYKDFAWQPRFYDHIIRDEKSLNNIRAYISGNPVKWNTDQENLSNLYM